ncbi:50S ribosomal protein L18 [Bacteroidetes bacterium endosymbiont of Geopemphigus sp.]|uniref:50S ribosomal protein L18 n=1 Tax=Bacteroidetes bacterium endosymbiont of Geopemphigus sp. TaxID=2047937 RepID=UPI000CD2E059|nr:50S ribosomal protein L18 [Bacteroidetes bacterium endosymbiont of Geopemphigus sp.]
MNVKSKRRKKIKQSVRKKIFGTPERPRLSVYRSNKGIFAQVIDDANGLTLISSASEEKDLKIKANKSEKATLVGKKLGEKASKAGIKRVIFDRNGYLYHGRIKALAEAAREAGLEF